MKKEYEVLREKYQKVKRFYFEKDALVQSSEQVKAELEEKIKAKEAAVEAQGKPSMCVARQMDTDIDT